MFSHLNHHHESSAVPQTHGVRRPHSPETSHSEGSEGDTAQLLKHSPHTRRVVKKLRVTTGASTSSAQAVDSPQPSTAATGLPPKHDEATTSKTDTDHAQRLEMLLDSVLATLVIMQTVGTTQEYLTPHASDAIRVILSKLSTNLPPNAPPLVSPNAPQKPPPKGQSTTPHPPQRMDTTVPSKGTQTKVLPAGPSPRSPNVQLQHPQQPKHVRLRDTSRRLIIRLPHSENALTTHKDITRFVTGLNEDLRVEYDRPATLYIAGANMTQAGNMILTTNAPYTAAQLHEKTAIILSALEDHMQYDKRNAMVDFDAPWHSVVVQDIPGVPLLKVWNELFFPGDNSYWTGPRDIYRVIEEAGISQDELKDISILCQKPADLDPDDLEGQTFSLRLRVSSPECIARLLREGLSLFNTRCRVSRYRPRKK